MKVPHPLFGRDELLRQVESACGRSRLVTLVGPGGIGKTSLARYIAAADPQSVWVDLGHITDAHDAEWALSQALGRPNRQPIQALRARRPHLVVLDNIEQLIGRDAEEFVALLVTAPEPIILVTSRTRLQLVAESGRGDRAARSRCSGGDPTST